GHPIRGRRSASPRVRGIRRHPLGAVAPRRERGTHRSVTPPRGGHPPRVCGDGGRAHGGTTRGWRVAHAPVARAGGRRAAARWGGGDRRHDGFLRSAAGRLRGSVTRGGPWAFPPTTGAT